jgi:hypothetical protein
MYLTIAREDKVTVILNGEKLDYKDDTYYVELTGTPVNQLIVTYTGAEAIDMVAKIAYPEGSEGNPIVIDEAAELTSVKAEAGASTYYAINSMLNGNTLTVVAAEGLTVSLNGTALEAVDGLYTAELTGAPVNMLVVANAGETAIETVAAIEAAVANAKDLGAQAGDTLKLAVIPGLGDSVGASAEKAGTAQLNVDVAAVTFNAEGVISSCYIDSVQAKVAFDATGAVTTDLSAPVKTKNQLGADYGMVAWGGAVAEWDAQAASFAAYVTGKTPAEVAGMALNEKTGPADADLATSVTISDIGFQNLIAKAAK